MTAGAANESVAGTEEPLKVAVMVAVWSAVRVPVEAVKVAEVALAGTLTEEGTFNAVEALLASATTELPVGALDRATVQVALALDARVAGAHCSEVRVTGAATSERVAGTEEPFKVAVMVAVWSAVRVPVEAVNVAEVALAGTLTEEGTFNAVEALLASATTELPVVALDRATVQVALALDARVAGAH